MISSFFNLPFGGWVYCQFPSVTSTNSYLGKIESGGDLLIWIGSCEFVIGRSKKSREAAAVPGGFDDTNTTNCPPTERLYRMLRTCSAQHG